MPRESFAEKKTRVREIISGLTSAYPDAHCELNFSNPLQLLIATILSAQTTDRQVNVVTEPLFQKFRNASDFANASISELEHAIRRIGLFRNKARNIQAACRALVQKYDGRVPATMQQLIELEGVGRKTANVVLSNAFGINEGFVVDTHVARLSKRLGLSRNTQPEKIELDLQQLTQPSEWMFFSHLLIWHGRRRCFARNPDCPGCEVRHLCPTGQKVLKLPPERRKAMQKQI